MIAEQTLALVNAAIESRQESKFRTHLGASVIGKQCAREIWFGWRWTLEVRYNARQLRLWERGQLEEARFVGYLRAAGVEVWDFDPNLPHKDGKPQQFKISHFEGHFGGSLDGIVRGLPELPPGTLALAEFKTHNWDSFAKLIKSNVVGSKFEHFVQANVYAAFYRLPAIAYFPVRKDDDEWRPEVFAPDLPTAQRAIARAGDIIYSNEPPPRISSSSGSFACKFCEYNEHCHFGTVEVARNCRTCRFSRPGANALWICGLRNVTLDKAAQLTGCGSYQIHTKLHGKQVT